MVYHVMLCITWSSIKYDEQDEGKTTSATYH